MILLRIRQRRAGAKDPFAARVLFFNGLLAVMILAGCAARQERRVPTLRVIDPLPDAAQLLRSLADKRSALRSMSAFARFTYTSPEGSQKAKQVVVAARPDRLRFEVLSPFGTVFVLVTRGGELAAYAPRESVVYRGSASAKNLQRYAQVALPVSAAVDLLLGTPSLPTNSANVVSSEDGHVKLWQADDHLVQVTWFSAALEPLRYEQQDEEGRVIVRATFRDYTEIDGVRLPLQLGLELPPARQRIDIELRDPEVNPVLAEAVFTLETPQGSGEIDLDQVIQ